MNGIFKENYVIEREYIHSSLLCSVVFCQMGHRCGYVGVPASNKFWGMKYDDVANEEDEQPPVHGGLTYSSSKPGSNYPSEGEEDTWWFGFDCAHCGDKPDFVSRAKYFPSNIPEIYDGGYYGPDDIVWTLEDVMNECDKLAEWLSRYGSQYPA